MGTMYYLGCNENFGNHRANGLLTRPGTPRSGIGLAHSDTETGDQGSDADFEAYVIRIVDEGSDAVRCLFTHSSLGPIKHLTLFLGHFNLTPAFYWLRMMAVLKHRNRDALLRTASSRLSPRGRGGNI